MQIPFEFELGEVLRETITGYTGVVMGRTQYFTGCNHYGLLNKKLNDKGKPDDWEWFDQSRLVRTKQAKIVLDVKKRTSAPGNDAPSIG